MLIKKNLFLLPKQQINKIYIDKQVKKSYITYQSCVNFNKEYRKMAKKQIKVKVKLESTAGTGTFYLAEKNPRTHPEKLSLRKYDKKSKKHEEFVEKKLK